ncbi:acyl carrier protein [Streptomyces sp. SID8358]|uniref:acyl carrier protein n=1 Tax=Streptomyces sp. SID8358 TaxID=2690342 RepID=UPI000DADEC70|nr:phosphopantetheine-binding protein [Streptomyces sp. SID8358]MYU32136.1 acyl carrier protein [Streptomyces sp. SID8358]
MYETITQLLIEEFGIEAERVCPTATVQDLELDSLTLAELSVILTEQTGVRVEDVDLGPVNTLAELAERFTAALSAASADAAGEPAAGIPA